MERFFCTKITDNKAELLEDQARHIYSVMRLKVGCQIEIFDGSGTLAQAAITEANSKKIQVEILYSQTINQPDQPKIIIAASIAKGDRFEWMISKCTELGADAIIPVIYQRTVKQPSNEKILNRWQTIIISAAKQCKRLFLPQIQMPVKFDNFLEQIEKSHPNSQIIVGSLDEDSISINDFIFTKDTIVLIGPEGGFSGDESKITADIKAKKIKLNQNILRTETAAEAVTALLASKRMLLT